MQLACGHDHYGSRAKEPGDGHHQHLVEAVDRPGQLRLGARTDRGVSSAVRQSAQRQPRMAQLTAHLGNASYGPVVAPAADGDQSMQPAVDIGKLDEGGWAQRSKQIGQFGRAGPAADGIAHWAPDRTTHWLPHSAVDAPVSRPNAAALPRSFTSLTLHLRLSGEERGRVITAAGTGRDVLGQPAQLGKVGSQDVITGGTYRQRLEAVGPVAFHPLQDAARPPRLEGEAQPLPGGVPGVGGDVGSELRCGQIGLLVTDNCQRAAHCDHGPAPVSPGQTGYAFCFPGRQPPGGRSPPAAGPGPVQLGGPGVEVPSGEPQQAGYRVSHRGPVREAHSVQPSGGVSGKCSEGATVIFLGPRASPARAMAASARACQPLRSCASNSVAASSAAALDASGSPPRRAMSASSTRPSAKSCWLPPSLSWPIASSTTKRLSRNRPAATRALCPAKSTGARVDTDFAAPPVGLLEKSQRRR